MKAIEEGEMIVADVEAHADDVEEELVEVESREDDPVKSAERATTELTDKKWHHRHRRSPSSQNGWTKSVHHARLY